MTSRGRWSPWSWSSRWSWVLRTEFHPLKKLPALLTSSPAPRPHTFSLNIFCIHAISFSFLPIRFPRKFVSDLVLKLSSFCIAKNDQKLVRGDGSEGKCAHLPKTDDLSLGLYNPDNKSDLGAVMFFYIIALFLRREGRL